jgi:hypothetical protein
LSTTADATDAFFRLVDGLDSEANAVTHAIIEARSIAAEMLSATGRLLAEPTPERRVWMEVGLRLMRQRAALVQAVTPLAASLPGPGISPSDAWQEIVIPAAPKPRYRRSNIGGTTSLFGIAMPTPPVPRWR